MAGRAIPYEERASQFGANGGAPEGLKLLAIEEGPRESALLPRHHLRCDMSDSDDFFLDVAQQMQQAEVRERLKTIVESNRGGRSRRGSSSKAHRDTVASLRQVASLSRSSGKFSSLSCVSEGSSEAPLPESSQQLFLSAAARDLPSEVCSSSGAPASGEDDLSAFLEDSFDGDRLSSPPHAFPTSPGRAFRVANETFATKEELAAVLACLRRVERKVDWLMSQERKAKACETAIVIRPMSLLDQFFEQLWIPTKANLRAVWPCRLLVPALDLAEAVARHLFC